MVDPAPSASVFNSVESPIVAIPRGDPTTDSAPPTGLTDPQRTAATLEEGWILLIL